MNKWPSIYDRFLSVSYAYTEVCASNPEIWHRPDTTQFAELKVLLLPHAQAGDPYCQYALASILWLGLCCGSEKEYQDGYAAATREATDWWIAAAKQGLTGAVDNLAGSGVGEEAERAREAWRGLERERRDLVGQSCGMPVYGPGFIEELTRRLYGRVITDAD